MVTLEDQSTIDTFIQNQTGNPMPRKDDGKRKVYLRHNDFGPIPEGGLGKIIPQITDFGQAQRGDKSKPLILPIQPNEYRAPEVLLGIGWSYSADIWNFGTMVGSQFGNEAALSLSCGRSGISWLDGPYLLNQETALIRQLSTLQTWSPSSERYPLPSSKDREK